MKHMLIPSLSCCPACCPPTGPAADSTADRPRHAGHRRRGCPGTPIELVQAGFRRTEGPVGMPDGSLLFSERDNITRIDGTATCPLSSEPSNAANAVGFDPQGRLISVQRAQGNEKVGVLYPSGSESVLADSFEGSRSVVSMTW